MTELVNYQGSGVEHSQHALVSNKKRVLRKQIAEMLQEHVTP